MADQCSSVRPVCYKVGILTVSDSCFAGENEDISGKLMLDLLSQGKIFPTADGILKKVVPDEKEEIAKVLKSWADECHVDLILTTGGTGFSPRDITPEATLEVSERQASSLAHSVITLCHRDTPFALLSRATCGIRGKTLIFNLPGSAKGSQECFMKIAQILPHALDQLKENVTAIEKCHTVIQGLWDINGSSKSKVDVSKTALRPRVSPYEMLSTEEALSVILSKCPCLGIERRKYQECVGFTCQGEVKAKYPTPPFRASIKDGYAVFASEGVGQRKIQGVSTAGDDPSKCELKPGGAIRVNTGGPVPPNADVVVQVEDTVVTKKTEEGDVELEIEILKMPETSEIRETGSDIAQDQVIIPHGKTITAFDIGLLVAAGIEEIDVCRPPRVAVLSTGDELLEPGESLKPGCIIDSNRATLAMMLKKMNLTVFDAHIAKDSPDDLKFKLERAFDHADVIIVTGGNSMGEKDFVKCVLEVDFLAKMHFARVHMKPGKPTAFSTLTFNGKEKLVFCLPGNPVSAVVTFHLFVIPCLRMIMGYREIMQLVIKAKLGNDISLDPRPEYHRVCLTWEEDKPVAHSTGSQLSSRLLSLNDANALMVLPPKTEKKPMLFKNSEVSVMLLDYYAP